MCLEAGARSRLGGRRAYTLIKAKVLRLWQRTMSEYYAKGVTIKVMLWKLKQRKGVEIKA
jgi:hypothetical protein